MLIAGSISIVFLSLIFEFSCFVFPICEKALLRFQYREILVDIHVDDIDKINLLDLVLGRMNI